MAASLLVWHGPLRFKHHLRAEPFGPERVFLISERERFLLHGRGFALVAPLIDGRRTADDVISLLEEHCPPPEVLYTLKLMEEQGHLTVSPAVEPPEEAGFWESQGVSAAHATERLAAASVAVRALAGEEARPLIQALADAGIQTREPAGLHAVLTGDYLAPELEAWNQEMLRTRARWIPIKVAGAECWVGPLFGAPEGPCWECLAARLRENRPVETYLQRGAGHTGPLRPPRTALPIAMHAGLGIAAFLLARWIASGGRGPLDGQLVTVDLGGLRIREHTVVRRPQCPACGDPGLVARRARAPVVLESRLKRFTDDGGHRCISPEETLSRYQHHVSPLTGIVSDLRSTGAEHEPLRQVYGAVSRACPLNIEAPSFEHFHRTSSGKGRTPAQARAGALCEAIERYSAVFQGDESRIRARRAELGEDAIHPDALQGFSEAQYRAREETNRGLTDPRRRVPPPYDEAVSLDWTPVWSLTHRRHRYVPTSYCYLHAPLPPAEQFCSFNSNGNAAGNCLEEAILQGFLELVERDAVAVWWYNRLPRPGVELRSFGQPYFQALEERYRALGLELWALDITHDLGLPTFAAVAREPVTGRIWMGCGCHFEARLALQRALTELNQCLDPMDRSSSPWSEKSLVEPAFLFPLRTAAPRTREDFPETPREDLREDVLACTGRAERAGLEVLVLDQTRPDVGLNAVKVIVPGLRHFWPRFGPGRLYDVPVRLGLRTAPLSEGELNPVPFFF